MNVACHNLKRRLAEERWATAQKFEQQDARTVDVGACVDLLSAPLLRGHVSRGTNETSHAGQLRPHRGAIALELNLRLGIEDLSRAKIEDLNDLSCWRIGLTTDHDVFRLDIAMYDALLMSVLERLAHLHHDGDRGIL